MLGAQHPQCLPQPPLSLPLHPLCTRSGLRAVTLTGNGRWDRRRWDERLDRGTLERSMTFNRQLANCRQGFGAWQQTRGGPRPHWLHLEGAGKQGACWLAGTGPMRRRQRWHAESLASFAAISCVRCLWCLTARPDATRLRCPDRHHRRHRDPVDKPSPPQVRRPPRSRHELLR